MLMNLRFKQSDKDELTWFGDTGLTDKFVATIDAIDEPFDETANPDFIRGYLTLDSYGVKATITPRRKNAPYSDNDYPITIHINNAVYVSTDEYLQVNSIINANLKPAISFLCDKIEQLWPHLTIDKEQIA